MGVVPSEGRALTPPLGLLKLALEHGFYIARPRGASPDTSAEDVGVAGVGVADVERRLVWIIAAFGILYSLQNLDGLIADWPSMSGPVGAAVVTLVAASCCLALAGVIKHPISRHSFTLAVIAFAGAAALWPFALHAPLPAAPFPWLTSTWPVEAVYLCGATRRVWVPLVASAAAAIALSATLAGPGGLAAADLISTILPMCAISAVLILLIGALRHRIRRAEASRQNSLMEYQASQHEAATEAERVRTDALVHDSVLTTLLSAAAAASMEDEELATRMASNALRVLSHVNRRDEHGQLLPFALLLEHARNVVPEAFGAFAVDAEQADSVVLPTAAADAVLAAMVEAMDNSVRHGGGADRSLNAVPLGPDGIRVVVADSGTGFDAGPALALGRGLQVAIVERMRQVYGRADIVTAPNEGTRVTISWGSIVISGTRPLEDREITIS